MLIKDLPEVIQMKALVYRQSFPYIKDSEQLISFQWSKTPEGEEVWHSVNHGNFQPFYDFHKISPASEWVPKEGEMVEVNCEGNNYWYKKYYVAKYKGLHVCSNNEYGGNGFDAWDNIRKYVVRLTRTEIAEKFGVNKDFEFVEE